MWALLISSAFALSDADGDGYHSGVDCDDANPSVYPGATELCDGVDTDCDGSVPSDEIDADGDFYVACAEASVSCSDWASVDTMNSRFTSIWALTDSSGGLVDDNGNVVLGGCDCNDDSSDADASKQSPGQVEECELGGVAQIDNDCDGDPNTDSGVAVSDGDEYFLDADGDGFGDATVSAEFCVLPSGYATNSMDCYDRDATVNPSAPEVCNGRDDDCDGSIDNSDYHSLGADSGCIDVYLDSDEDGYGGDTILCLCDTGEAGGITLGSDLYVYLDGDCYDGDADIYPGAPERMTGWDDDCDGRLAYAEADCDGDSYRAVEPGSSCSVDASVSCWGAPMAASCDPHTGWLMIDTPDVGDERDGGDCDDQDASIHPGAAEIVSDGIDQDCDGDDVDGPFDTGSPELGETGDTGGGTSEKGCSCSSQSAGPGSAFVVLLLGLVGLFRRRED